MANVAKALAVVEQLHQEGLSTKYAVGGAVGAIFYLKPSNTQHIDIFISGAGSLFLGKQAPSFYLPSSNEFPFRHSKRSTGLDDD